MKGSFHRYHHFHIYKYFIVHQLGIQASPLPPEIPTLTPIITMLAFMTLRATAANPGATKRI